MNDECRFDQRNLDGGRTEGWRRGGRGTRCDEAKSQSNDQQLPVYYEAETSRMSNHNKKGRPIGSPQSGVYNSSSTAAPPPSDSTPKSSGRAISPLRAFCRISPSISFIRSGFWRR